jgi:hypothetical protein
MYFLTKKIARLAWTGAILLALAAPTSAHAAFETATFSTVKPGQVVEITSGTVNEWGWAGDYDFINAKGGLKGSFSGFCIDINQEIMFGQTVDFSKAALKDAPKPGMGMGLLKANLIGELWYNDYKAIGTDDTKAAAFQIAIWKIINDTTSNTDKDSISKSTLADFNAGNFKVSGNLGAVSQATTWLKGIDPTGNGHKAAGLFALTSPSAQDYGVQGTLMVPAPSSLVLVGIGGLLVGFTSFPRRPRKTATA